MACVNSWANYIHSGQSIQRAGLLDAKHRKVYIGKERYRVKNPFEGVKNPFKKRLILLPFIFPPCFATLVFAFLEGSPLLSAVGGALIGAFSLYAVQSIVAFLDCERILRENKEMIELLLAKKEESDEQ